jgi:hypothetical protein
MWHACPQIGRRSAFHWTTNLDGLMGLFHMIDDYYPCICLCHSNFTLTFLLLRPTKETENIYLGPHGVPPSGENKAETTSVRTGCRDKNNKAREAYYKDLGTVLNSKRKHRWRLTLPRRCQPYQGPLEVSLLICPSCLVCNDTCFLSTS